MRDFGLQALAMAMVFGPCIALAQTLKWIFLPMGLGAFVAACAVTIGLLLLVALWIDSRPQR